MLKKYLWIWLLTLVFCLPAVAENASFPLLQKGKSVYAWPPDFDPPMIGKAGMAEIETELKKLKYRYFVVLVNELAGSGTDKEAIDLIEGLAERWSTTSASLYDAKTSQIFILSYHPRKYRFLAGAQFKNELGFEKAALLPYTQIFEKFIKGTPKLPKTGMIEMMKQVDAYLSQNYTPEAVQTRKTEQLKRQLASQKQASHKLLDRLKLLLNWQFLLSAEDFKLLREKVTEAERALEVFETQNSQDLQALDRHFMRLKQTDQIYANQIRQAYGLERVQSKVPDLIEVLKNAEAPVSLSSWQEKLFNMHYTTPEQRLPFQQELESVQALLAGKAPLEAYQPDLIENRWVKVADATFALKNLMAESDTRARDKAEILTTVLGFAALGLLIALITLFSVLEFKRKLFVEKWHKLKAHFEQVEADWKTKLDNAYQKALFFESAQRDAILGLKDMQGKTRELFETVTQQVDSILLQLTAMGDQLQACQALASEAHILNQQPLKQALEGLSQPFEFDTQKSNQEKLFGFATVMISLDPQVFEQNLQADYELALQGWNQLKAAADLRWQAPEALFPESLAEEILAWGEERVALVKHPLLETAQNRKRLYESLEHLRWQDPVAYADQIEALKEVHQTCLTELQGYYEILPRLAEYAAQPPQPFADLVLEDDQNPALFFEKAQTAYQALLISETQKQGLNVLWPQAQFILMHFETSKALSTKIEEILVGFEHFVTQLQEQMKMIKVQAKELTLTFKKIQAYHLDFDLSDQITQAKAQLQAAETTLGQALAQWKQKKVIKAWRYLEESEKVLLESQAKLVKVEKDCQAQEALRLEFLEKFQSHGERHLKFLDKAKAKGYRETNYTQMAEVDLETSQDYAELLILLNNVEESWSKQLVVDAESALARYSSYSSRSSSDSSSSGGSWFSDSSSSGSSWDSSSSSSGSSWDSSSSSSGSSWDSSSSSSGGSWDSDSSSVGGDW